MKIDVASEPESAGITSGAIATLLALFLAASYFPVLFGNQTFFYRDFGVLAIPTATFQRDAFWAGQIPLWNPLSNCGAPFLAQWGTMVCYPPSLIYLLLPLPWSLDFFCLLHLWAGGMGMFFLARRWMRSDDNIPAALAATGFIFNGISLGTLTWPNYTAALGLMPWVLLCIERVSESPRARTVIVAAFVAALQLLTGVPELAMFTWLLAGAFVVPRLIRSRGKYRSIMLAQAAVVLIASGLVAVQILPFFELLRHSQRAPGFAAEKWALPPWGWANFILPRFHTFNTAEGTVFQYGQEFLSSTWLGAPLLLLAFFGALRRGIHARILAGFAVLGAILALGSAGYLYPVLTRIFPVLGIARYPVKFLFLDAFAVPLLAGYGLHALFTLPEPDRRRRTISGAVIFGGVFALLVWMNLRWPFQLDWPHAIQVSAEIRALFLVLFSAGVLLLASPRFAEKRHIAAAGLLALLALDARIHLPNQNPSTASAIFARGFWEQAQQVPAPDPGAGRVFISPAAEERMLHTMIADPQQDLLGKRLALWSHLNLLDRIPKVNGSSTLQVAQQADVQKYLYSVTNRNVEAWLDFLGVALETSSNSAVAWQPRHRPMPFVTGGQAVIRAQGNEPIGDLAWDPATKVILNSDLAEKPEPSFVRFSEVRITAKEISFTAESARPALAVIAQSWYPAWKYSVTSANTVSPVKTVLRANHAFQAVPLPSGKSSIRIFYQDDFYRAGCVISVATLLLCVAILLWEARTNKNALLKPEKSVA